MIEHGSIEIIMGSLRDDMTMGVVPQKSPDEASIYAGWLMDNYRSGLEPNEIGY